MSKIQHYVKQKLPDEDVTKILTALPPAYHVVKEIISNQPDRTIATVIAVLRRHAEIVQPDAPSNPTGGA